jgi:hypothetical protein
MLRDRDGQLPQVSAFRISGFGRRCGEAPVFVWVFRLILAENKIAG